MFTRFITNVTNFNTYLARDVVLTIASNSKIQFWILEIKTNENVLVKRKTYFFKLLKKKLILTYQLQSSSRIFIKCIF